MEFELHIRGTIDEISQITTLIQNKVNREKSKSRLSFSKIK